MKQSKRNLNNERSRAEKRQSKPPVTSKYAEKVRKQLEQANDKPAK